MTQLETQRLKLRKFTSEDFDAVHSYAGATENITYMPFRANTPQQTRSFLDIAIAQAEEIPCLNHQYAVVLKESEALIGGCNLSIHGDEGEIGWLLHRDAWRQGYGTEIGKALLELGFGRKGLHRITARCDGENTASYRVMEKIGMRREGHFLECRKGGKYPEGVYGDEYSYAITKGEWEAHEEIAYYNRLPCVFEGFIDLPDLSDDVIRLVCVAQKPENPEKNWVPSYGFAICRGSEKVGEIDIRIGYGGGLHGGNLYYGGQIGYHMDEKHRGNGYACRACRLLLPIAKAHGMEKLLITNEYTNTASRRVCEKLGARLLRVARLPQWHDLYEEGQRFVNVYEWDVGACECEMEKKIVHVNGVAIAIIQSNAPLITDAQSALDLIATIDYYDGCQRIAIYKKAIAEDFFQLHTGIAGEILQKFSNYAKKLAIIGDFSIYSSKALRDFIYECNQGKQIFFVADEQGAIDRLSGAK